MLPLRVFERHRPAVSRTVHTGGNKDASDVELETCYISGKEFVDHRSNDIRSS
jgi:hypothetical protein